MCQLTGQQPFVKGTKTGTQRTVPLAQVAVDAFMRLRLMRSAEAAITKRNPEAIFTDLLGDRYSPQAATTAFGDIARKAGLASTRLHDLRHVGHLSACRW